MFQWLRDLLVAYTSKELWILVSVPTLITGVWSLICVVFYIPITFVRAFLMWCILLVLTALGVVAQKGEGWREGVEKYSA